MKRMPLSRLFALPLALTLLLSPAAQALTPDQARELLQDYYIDEVPEDVLDQNTIQAMLEALGDPYTTYFSPEEYGAFTGSMSDTDTAVSYTHLDVYKRQASCRDRPANPPDEENTFGSTSTKCYCFVASGCESATI